MVQALVSAQSASVAQQPGVAVCRQLPGDVHESAVQGFPSSQLGGVPGVHVPPWHISGLHTSPLPHAIPSTTGRLRQPKMVSHESFVQGFPSSQFTASLTHEPP